MIGGLVQMVLTADSRFTDVFGTRLYPDHLPQSPTYPAARYVVVTAEAFYTMEGPADLGRPRLQLDLYASTKAEVVAGYKAVMGVLSGFRGTVASTPPVRIQGVFKENEFDNFAGEMEKAGPRTYHKTVEFIIVFEESF